MVQDSLKAYLALNDAFSDYLTREEYIGFKQLQGQDYVGIGMEIQKDANGEIVCIPDMGGPAERAGIQSGDLLRSIDSTPVHGKSLPAVAAMVRGRRGEKISLTVVQKSGVERQVLVTLDDVRVESVSKYWVGEAPVIRISSFAADTREGLRLALREWPRHSPIIIDLRGNRGGDLLASVDSAMLFLEKGRRVATVRKKHGSEIYESSHDALPALPGAVFLWQDENTASAAEVFIAALTRNQKAVSIGRKTYGKGSKQDIIEMSDGAALILTTGMLQTPDGKEYQGIGLNPTYQLHEIDVQTSHYIAKVRELM